MGKLLELGLRYNRPTKSYLQQGSAWELTVTYAEPPGPHKMF